MPGGRPRILTADQIARATRLRHDFGLPIVECAAAVGANRETLREQFVRDGTVPLPPLDAPVDDVSVYAPKDDAPTIDVDDAGFPASSSMPAAPVTGASPYAAAPPPSLESIRSAWAAGRAADLRDGWATDLAVSEMLASKDPLRDPLR